MVRSKCSKAAEEPEKWGNSTWVFRCHELHHTENDGVEPGGLIQVIQYEGVGSASLAEELNAPTPLPATIPGMDH